MPRLVDCHPKYSKHKASGQAVCAIEGRSIYLGRYGTKESRDRYDKTLAEWLANGRHLPGVAGQVFGFTVVELVDRFCAFAQEHYRRPDGTQTSEIKNFRIALTPLLRLYETTPVASFGPLALRAVREEMIRIGWSRKNINQATNRVRHVFKWGVSRELIPPSVLHALSSVEGLQAGRSAAKESAPVGPVPEAHVEAVLPFVSPPIKAMIEIQLLTAMRPGEVVAMRGIDLDTTGKLWMYRPAQHKNSWRVHDRVIYLGPKAQGKIRPFLKTDLTAHLFSPIEADAWRRAQMRTARKTPLSCGNRAGTNRANRPRKAPGKSYTVESYGHAIKYGCARAFPPPSPLRREPNEAKREWSARLTPEQWVNFSQWQKEHGWHPNQLRHSAATRLRKEYGLEAAQVILGHRTLTVTQVYAEKNIAAAQQLMSQIG